MIPVPATTVHSPCIRLAEKPLAVAHSTVTDPTLSIKIMEFSRMAKPTPTAMAIGSTLFLRSSSKTAYKSTGIALSNSSVMGGTSSEKLLALSPVMGYTMVLIS